MDISFLKLAMIFGAGLMAGFASTMAGGSSFLTLAVLEFAELPSAMANGTNRVAVEARNIMAVLGFRSKGVSDFGQSLHFAAPALLGAILGAYVVIDMPAEVFQKILAAAMVIMLVPTLFDSKKWLQRPEGPLTTRRRLLAYLAFFVVGIYGGAIHAGIGFLLIALLVLVTGEDLVHTASHKAFVIAVYTLFALFLFALKGQIHWGFGLALAAGEGTGGWVASRLAVSKGETLVRIVLAIMLIVVALRYLGIIPGL